MSSTASCYCPTTEEAESIKHFSFDIADSIALISEFQWNNQIPSSNLLMQYSQLQLIEGIQSGIMQFRYVLVKQNEVIVGAMYFQVVLFHADQLINYFPESSARNPVMRSLKSFSEKLLNAINVKLLVSGNVFMTGENGFYFSSEVDKPTRAKILRTAVSKILKSDSAIKAALISDLYHPKTEFDAEFKKSGYNEIYVESDMSITLRPEWQTFDDYINSLTSKYRVRARKVFMLCNENGVTRKILSEEEIGQQVEHLHELYNKVVANADFKLAELSRDFFYAQKKSLPHNYQVFAYYKQEKMIGFISCFLIGKRMEVHYTGMDAEVSKPIHLYQHMMYDMVKFGIDNHVDRLHFGRTAPEIKSTIGAIPSGMYGYLKHRNPLFNFFIARPYTANLKPRDYTFRHPFKEL